MAQFPSDSAVKLTEADNAKIREMDIEQIKEYIKSRMVEQNLVKRDIYDQTVLIPVASAEASSSPLQRTVTVNGADFTLQATTEAELNAMETELYRRVLNGKTADTVEQPRNEQGQFTSREDAAAAEVVEVVDEPALRLEMMSGKISADEYLTRSGKLAEYLKTHFGLDAEEIQNRSFTQSWTDATQAYLSTVSADEWWGGDENQKVIQNLIVENDLSDAEDKVDALRRVIAFAKENDLLTPNPAVAERDSFMAAKSPDEIRSAAYRITGRQAPESRIEQSFNSRWGSN